MTTAIGSYSRQALDEGEKKKLTTTYSRIHVRSPGGDVWMSADLILAADGMNSIVRKRMAVASGHVDQLVPNGESAYRFVLPMELVKHDATVMSLLGKNHGMRYMGPGGHIMAYPLRKNTLYNVVLIHKADGKKSGRTSWSARGKKEEILEYYRGWSPIVRALISHVPDSEVMETPMNNMPPLPTWVKGKIALAGDACRKFLLILFSYPLTSHTPKIAQTITLDPKH